MTESSGRIALLGTGLIGGSLGLVWSERCPDWTLIGFDRPDVLDRAHDRGAIEQRAADPKTLVEDADIVVLATPLGASLQMLEEIAPHVKEGAIVTDVASVKSPVMEQAAEVLPDHAHFVGGHPMAGAENSGIDAADALLFENAIYALCLEEEDEADGPRGDALSSRRAHRSNGRSPSSLGSESPRPDRRVGKSPAATPRGLAHECRG